MNLHYRLLLSIVIITIVGCSSGLTLKKANALRRGMSPSKVEALFEMPSSDSLSFKLPNHPSPLVAHRYSLSGYSSAQPFYLLFDTSGLIYWGYLYEFTRNSYPIYESAGLAIAKWEFE